MKQLVFNKLNLGRAATLMRHAGITPNILCNTLNESKLRFCSRRVAAVLLLTLLTTVTAWAQEISGLTYNTEGGYYEIGDAAALNALATYVNDGNDASDKTFKQTADIDMSGISYTPIGVEETAPFKGTYDGNDYFILNISHSISGVHILSGLFGDLYGTVKNVNLKDCYFTALRVGGIAAETHEGCLIQNCNVLGGTITCSDNNPSEVSGSYIGGIAGCNYQSTVENCFTTAALGGEAWNKGLVVSRSSGTVTDCYYVNGIDNATDSITNCVH